MDRFKNLKVWAGSHSLVLKIYKITKEFSRRGSIWPYRLDYQLDKTICQIDYIEHCGRKRKNLPKRVYLLSVYGARFFI